MVFLNFAAEIDGFFSTFFLSSLSVVFVVFLSHPASGASPSAVTRLAWNLDFERFVHAIAHVFPSLQGLVAPVSTQSNH